MDAKIVLLPGDGIGPEVTAEAEKVLKVIAERNGHAFELSSHPMGGNAIDDFGDPLPDETLAACQASNGVLLGAVGGPKWDDPNAKTRPEAGLLRIRKEMKLFANLRPIKTYKALLESSPLKTEIVEGVDILCFRELTGGIYFGQSGRREHESGEEAYSEMVYSTGEVERIVRLACVAAQNRDKKLTSIDKANVLEVSRLWRTATENVVRNEFSALEFENVLGDASDFAASRFRCRRNRKHVRRHHHRRRLDVDGFAGHAAVRIARRGRAGTLRTDPRIGSGHRRQRHRQSAGDDSCVGNDAASFFGA